VAGNLFDDEEDFESTISADHSYEGDELGLHGGSHAGGHSQHGRSGGNLRQQLATVVVAAAPDLPDETPSETTAVPPQQKFKKNQKIRVRSLPAEWRKRWPQSQSMLVTNKDGTQILFVA
jgi:hypothetical protein